ncbi:phosphoribosylanthranilate isomerase [Hymenobacter pini]|uniref:phosphoribosylanthranilate isomerase n=1 Tax=Hymenobacter pini TaxID=2880879 RepID=UPI001CF1B814|nr:phosphoribosylanthranilate isomerase [Hymenobacter pini]MCA8829650.1 phosphoribosylanthranilate isomerase [Hymenobacter pini]
MQTPVAGLRLKVCGMREPANIAAVAALQPDFMGFIFYPKSGRYAGSHLTPDAVAHLPASTQKVGVFVDASTAEILARVAELGLHAVQLHGTEPPEQCRALRAAGVTVIKAVAVGEELPEAELQTYAADVDYFLFDTKGPQPGGNGTAFNWQLLKQYTLPVPYFLAGGIGPEHAATLDSEQLPGLFALDLNSRFEVAPGQKDVHKLRQMFEAIRPTASTGNSSPQAND